MYIRGWSLLTNNNKNNMTFSTRVNGSQITGNNLDDVTKVASETVNRKPRATGFKEYLYSEKRAPRVEMNAVDEIITNMRAQTI